MRINFQSKFIAQICLFLCLFIIGIYSNIIIASAEYSETKDILIINSYQNGLSWTDSEEEGIVETLHNAKFKNNIYIEYMDWKNYPTNENLEIFYSNLSYKYAKKHLDVVITTDDAALDFALKNRDDLFPNTPIVFCGVNEKGVQKLLHNSTDVTGVVESFDIEKTIEAALSINPGLKEIAIVYDNTESGISTGELAIQEIQRVAPELKIISLNNGSYSDILNQIDRISSDGAILITTYYMDDEETVVGFEYFCELISRRSPVPVYHLYEYGMDHGAIGGCMLSGKRQGEKAAELALKHLQGVNITEIPIDREKTTRYIFDYNQLKRFSIPENRIPKDSQILNKPFSFIETYRDLVITTLLIIITLVTFILILLYYIRKISRMKKRLYDNNIELNNLYEDLTASDEELRQQYDELNNMQKNLMASEERYAQLFDRMLNGFIVFDPIQDDNGKLLDVRFISVNSSFERQTQLKKESIIGERWNQVFPTYTEDLEKLEQVLTTGNAKRFETYFPEYQMYFLVSAFRIDNNQIGLVIENITEYKKAIEEVGKLNAELEQRVTMRTHDLQQAIQELEAFTYTVSHDLKSPLRAVDGYSKIILEDYQEELKEDVARMLSHIRNICSEMIDMINKLLQYSTTSRKELHLEAVDCNELIAASFQELKCSVPDRRIKFKVETGLPTALADKVMLKQVLNNILSNAIKFTKNREITYITAGATITENEYVFYVKDNGVGFDMNYSGKLFGLFQRLHTSDEFEGSGIGLITIKKIIEKHGGRVWIEGQPDKGATIYFTLPNKWADEMKGNQGDGYV
jgi:signal transduction histidine kinase